MKIISLGYSCYVKGIIDGTKYNKDTDIFDWMNSFEFNKLIKSLDDNFEIFKNITVSPISVDLGYPNRYFNNLYSFRLPHEFNLNESVIKYKRRFERFKEYKNINDNYLFIRMINYKGRYNIHLESIEDNYNEECYNKLMSYLPKKSKILLITNEKMTEDDKNKIYNKFYIVDNIINPEHAAFGDYLQYKNKIINCYQLCFQYIDENFDKLENTKMYNFIKNEHIGL